jgi:drug/metabolite transporter (DMT)-like permease
LLVAGLRQPFAGYPAHTYVNFLALGLLVQVFGYLAISYALGHLPASLVAPIMLGQPVVTAVLAGPLLGETLTLLEIAGGVAVLAGVYIVHRSRQKR